MSNFPRSYSIYKLLLQNTKPCLQLDTVKNNLRAEDNVRNTSKITQLEEGKKINNQLEEWTRKLREPCRGVARDVEEEEGRGRTD